VAQFNDRDSLGYGKRRQLYAKTEEEAYAKLEAALDDGRRGVVQMKIRKRGIPFDVDNQHVYAIQCEHGGPIKIGMAYDIDKRFQTMQSNCPYPLRVLYVIEHGGRDVERRLHRTLHPFRLHYEWFEDTPLVRSALDKWLERAVEAKREREGF
jgi:hypothetical protein